MKDEISTKHATQIPESAYIKLLNAIVRIEVKGGQGTGFFLKFKKKDKIFFSLFTNYHVISKDLVNSKDTISFYYGPKGEETRKTIKLDESQREIYYFDQPKDVTVFEILKSDNIPEDKYLLPDVNYKNVGYKMYSESDFYLAGYPSVDDIYNEYEGERHVSSGKIKRVFNNFEFEHTLDTRKGSSGSPICLINNRCVIGIHKAGDKNTFINQGTFLGEIIDSLENDLITIRCRLEDLDRPIMIKVNPKDNIISTIINKLNLGSGNKYNFFHKCHIIKRSYSFKDYKIKDNDLILIMETHSLSGW